jgi:hypothetical protein
MYRDLAHWELVRRRVLVAGASQRQAAKEFGLARETVQKMLLHKHPRPYGPRSRQHYFKLGEYTTTIDQFIAANALVPAPFRKSVMDIYNYLRCERGYSGSYSAVRDYVARKLYRNRGQQVDVWSDTYEAITSLNEEDALNFMKMVSCAKQPVFSHSRARRLFAEIAALPKVGETKNKKRKKINKDIEWIHNVICGKISKKSLHNDFGWHSDFHIIATHLSESRLTYRSRAIAVLAIITLT